MSACGMDRERLERVKQTISEDVTSGLYHGAVIRVARAGQTVLDVAIGSHDAEGRRPLQRDSVFSIFSMTKAFTNVLTLRAIELGRFALTSRISDLIPEFSGYGRERIQIAHLLSYQAGFPVLYEMKPGMYIDRFDEVLAAVLELARPVHPPGERVAYSPLINHVLLAEALRRTDPKRRSYREMMQEEILAPLRLADTSVGLRADLRERYVRPDFRGNFPIEHRSRTQEGPNGAFEDEHAEMPWVGMVSTANDVFRFAEMLRQRGSLDGARVLSPAMLEFACRNHTGDKPNDHYAQRALKRGWPPAPAYMGLGFPLRGEQLCHHIFGTLASPSTFGSYGAGSSLFWVDPKREITFVCLTAGVMESTANLERFQRLSDMVISAAH